MSATGSSVKPRSHKINGTKERLCVCVCVCGESISLMLNGQRIPLHWCGIFFREGLKIPFARLTTCLLEKPKMLYRRNPPWRLLMCLLLPHTYTLNVPTHTSLTFLLARLQIATHIREALRRALLIIPPDLVCF